MTNLANVAFTLRDPQPNMLIRTVYASHSAMGYSPPCGIITASAYWHSFATLAHWCRVRNYLTSAANHGLSVLVAIGIAIKGKPWLPPLHAIA